MVNIIVTILFLLILGNSSFGQNKKVPPVTKHYQERVEQNTLPIPSSEFESITAGLTDGKVNQISRFFSSQVYLSLRSGERGYYSSNQAYYLIDNFFKIYEPINFQATSKMMESSTPYLAGKLYCRFKGSIEIFNLYLSLNWNGYSWEITQLSIN
ncbi:MAG: DUF4783 domain-containing protein [Ignavibacteria bacterium]|nr:DUF4783 domain-containing protein [Ignavibacteria bacterium]